MTDPSIPIVPGTPTPPPAAPYQPPPNAKANLTPLYWFGGTFLVLVLIGCGICGVSAALNTRTPSSGPADGPASKDVSIDCSRISSGFAKVTLRVTNSTSRQRTYFVDVAFRDGSTRVGTTSAVIRDVPAGGTAVEERTASVAGDSWSTCQVTDVDRV